jgi:mannosyl-3-phosphoglycerate synthase
MRIKRPGSTERLGGVRIHDIQEVCELDSRLPRMRDDLDSKCQEPHYILYDAINTVQKRMAIVIPCKDEPRRILEGVLSGIPPTA